MTGKIIISSVITCPNCGKKRTERMPQYASKEMYQCKGCKTTLSIPHKTHCIFCAFGTVPCPPEQRKSEKRKKA